jgi:hypothetical protein
VFTRARNALAVCAVGFLGLAGLVLCGCSSGSQTGTVEGRFLMVGGPVPGFSIPVAGTVTVTASDGHRTVLHVARNTRFKTTVAAGNVSVVGRSRYFDGGRDDCQPDHRVVVKAGSAIHADVLCQMM